MKSPLYAAVLVMGAACSSLADPAISDALNIHVRDGALQLENVSNRQVFYFIYERQAAALILWERCVDPGRCSSLAPDAQATVPYPTIGGYAPGKTEAIVYWWYAVPGPGGRPVPGDLAGIVVHL